MKVLLLGATGLTGDKILRELVANDAVKQITTLTRRPVKVESEKIKSIVDSDTANWYKPEYFAGNDVAISAFGTTRAAAGGIQKFKEIDYGNNLKFAETAKANGIEQFVLISSGGANPKSLFPYLKIKGELEQKVLDLDFKSTVIFKPGALLGNREEQRTLEGILIKAVSLPVISSLIPSNKVEVIGKKLVKLLPETASVKKTILEAKEINE